MPVEKRLPVLEAATPPADRANMAYSSSLVTYGHGRGIVVATGTQTEVGQISEMISSAKELATPLTRSIDHFGRVLFYGILALAAITFAVGLWRSPDWTDTEVWITMFQAAVALAVGAVPEALPAAVTVTLAIGVARMARRRAIIRKLPAVEALGSTTVICSDKTGTLTENRMTVREIWAGEHVYEVSGSGVAPSGQIAPVGDGASSIHDNRTLQQCLAAGMLCNEAGLEEINGRWQLRGDPTEGALLAAGMKAGLSRQELEQRFPRIDAIPFESEHGYSATLHDAGQDGPRVVFLKGAAEAVLSRCTHILDVDGQPASLDEGLVRSLFEEMAARGLRVLALATRELASGVTDFAHSDLGGGFTLLCLQGMIDPPRTEAIKAVATCQKAGIRVKMVTGDHALTAAVIADKLGLGTQAGTPQCATGIMPVPPAEAPHVVTGKQLAEMSDDELADVCERTDVFARVTPEQKLRLVRAHQAKRHIVAMTGDGVNDAPALKAADIGVAMGLAGTEVAKEAADMVLADDNFATIEAAVEEGRGVFDSLTKFIVWTLPTNLGDGLVVMAAIFAGVALPILPLQILWINMNAAVLLGLVLAFEPREPDIMLRKPRDSHQPILSRALIERIFLVGIILLVGAFWLFWSYRAHGLAAGRPERLVLAEARTIAVNFFVFVQVVYVFNCRSLTRSMFAIGLFSNPWVWLGTIVMAALQVLYTYNPVMNRLFDSAPITREQWFWALGLALVTYPIVGFEKWLRRHMARSATP